MLEGGERRRRLEEEGERRARSRERKEAGEIQLYQMYISSIIVL